MDIADLDHLIFLPSGDAAVSQRARKQSTLAAIVLKWSRNRRRYERQGLLVKYSGRIGRSASAKRMDEEAVRLAVIAHIRHIETDYDQILATGHDRAGARLEVQRAIYETLERWEDQTLN